MICAGRKNQDLIAFHAPATEIGDIYGLVSVKFGKYLTARAKFAPCNAANPGAGPVNNDADKLWPWLGFND